MSTSRSQEKSRKTGAGTTPFGTQVIQRTVAMLREIAAAGMQGIRLSVLADTLGLERSTAHRMLQGLVAQGMVMQEAGSHRYRLGHVAYELGLAAAPYFNLRELCEPTLRLLAQKTEDAIFLMVRSGLDAVCLDRYEGTYPVQARTLNVGGRRPLGMGAGGLALLMAFPEAEIEHILAVNGPRFATFGHSTPERLRLAIAHSRAVGYAVNDQDVLQGIGAIGATVQVGKTMPYVAISIAGVVARFDEKRREALAPLLLREVRQLERKLATCEGIAWEPAAG